MNDRKKILVTGGCGYVGSELVKELDHEGFDYLSVDRANPATEGKTVALDLCDRKSTVSLFREFNPTVIVHCGTNSAIAYRDRFVESFREDTEAISNILEVLKDRPGCRLIYFSSSYVYSGLPSKLPVKESTRLQPLHNFGLAKSFFEQMVLRVHPNTIVFRLSSVFGPGNALHPNTVFNMARECLETGKVTVWGAGSRRIQYVYMRDVLDRICAAFTLKPGVYNLGCNEYLSVAESARMIAGFLGAKVIFLKDKQEGETLPKMDIARLRRSSDGRMTPFRESLKEYLTLLRDKR
jgi:nucleoside-diphosphate-sugar epimerase